MKASLFSFEWKVMWLCHVDWSTKRVSWDRRRDKYEWTVRFMKILVLIHLSYLLYMWELYARK